jgi:hypothetical protein
MNMRMPTNGGLYSARTKPFELVSTTANNPTQLDWRTKDSRVGVCKFAGNVVSNVSGSLGGVVASGKGYDAGEPSCCSHICNNSHLNFLLFPMRFLRLDQHMYEYSIATVVAWLASPTHRMIAARSTEWFMPACIVSGRVSTC